jgi:CheY-like chemotaxis protein
MARETSSNSGIPESGWHGAAISASSSKSGGEQSQAQGVSGVRVNHKLWIVLVEDNPADVRLVREAFYESRLEYDLTVVNDGEKAIRIIERIDRENMACPDLMVLDIGLPRKGGFQVLECARASERCTQIPVVILTSSNAQEDRDMAVKLGATRYIRKPDDWEGYIGLAGMFQEILAENQRGGPK